MLRVFKDLVIPRPPPPHRTAPTLNHARYLDNFALLPDAIDLLHHVDHDDDRPAVLQEPEDDLVLVQLQDVGVELDAVLLAGTDFCTNRARSGLLV
jgi:hypothetical protein